MSMNLRHSQNTLSKQVNLSLPEMSFNLNRFYPLNILIKVISLNGMINYISIILLTLRIVFL